MISQYHFPLDFPRLAIAAAEYPEPLTVRPANDMFVPLGEVFQLAHPEAAPEAQAPAVLTPLPKGLREPEPFKVIGNEVTSPEPDAVKVRVAG